MTTNVRSLDETIHLTGVWLKEISAELGAGDRETAYRALRTTLHTLRDRMPPEEAVHFASQLPALIRGVYYDGYRLAGKPEKARTQEDFFRGLRDAFDQDEEIEALDAARATVSVIERHMTEGQFTQAMETIPLEFRKELLGSGV